jgi:hypothetical protein
VAEAPSSDRDLSSGQAGAAIARALAAAYSSTDVSATGKARSVARMSIASPFA